MLKIIFINGKEKIYKENEYEYGDANKYRICVRTKNKTVYFPLYNILSYEIENHQKEEKPKINKEYITSLELVGEVATLIIQTKDTFNKR